MSARKKKARAVRAATTSRKTGGKKKAGSKKKGPKAKGARRSRAKGGATRGPRSTPLDMLHGDEAKKLLVMLIDRHPELRREYDELAAEFWAASMRRRWEGNSASVSAGST